MPNWSSIFSAKRWSRYVDIALGVQKLLKTFRGDSQTSVSISESQVSLDSKSPLDTSKRVDTPKPPIR